MTQQTAAPNAIPWPPLIYGTATLAAVAMQRLIPLKYPQPAIMRMTGAILMICGLALDGSAMLTMHRQHANILPHRAATALVISWPFSISRNPIYLGNTLMLVGAVFVFANPWFGGMAAVAARAVTILAIRREEAHLAEMFRVEWRRYAEQTPRWFRMRWTTGCGSRVQDQPIR